MRIKLNRKSGTILIACVIVVLVIVVGGIAIIQFIRFCKKFLGPGGGGNTTNTISEVQYTEEYLLPSVMTPEVQKQVDIAIAEFQARTNPPCPGVSSKLTMPAGSLPDGTEVFLQRSTNLIDWEDLFLIDPDIEWCDPAPPGPQAYYRLRAVVTP